MSEPEPERTKAERSDLIRRYVDLQRDFLRNPLPAGPRVCGVCRGPRRPGYRYCFHCQAHHEAGDGIVADAVVPVSYSVSTGQHHHNLRFYKAIPRSNDARNSLLALTLHFLGGHLPCIAGAMGGDPTHLALVPSTRGLSGPHPLELMIGDRLNLPRIDVLANPAYGAELREFRADRFQVRLPETREPTRVLVIDDTWTTGSRVQSLAHLLKKSGAESVAAVVLGRYLSADQERSRELLAEIRNRTFDPDWCALTA